MQRTEPREPSPWLSPHPGPCGTRTQQCMAPTQPGRDRPHTPSGWEPAPFGSCSGEGWAFSISSSRSSRALSLPSELSCLSSPSTLSRAVGRAQGGETQELQGLDLNRSQGRGPGLRTHCLVPSACSQLCSSPGASKLEPGGRPGLQLPRARPEKVPGPSPHPTPTGAQTLASSLPGFLGASLASAPPPPSHPCSLVGLPFCLKEQGRRVRQVGWGGIIVYWIHKSSSFLSDKPYCKDLATVLQMRVF